MQTRTINKVLFMSINTSDRANNVSPSATLAINAKAKTLAAEGIDIINLSVGEPDFQTPAHVCQAGIDAIQAGHTKYTQAPGTPQLRAAICQKLQIQNNLTYQPEDIIVSNGAKQSLYNACQALLNPGDEAIIPAPFWVSYPSMVQLASATPIIIQTEGSQQFKITPEQLETHITERTRLLFLNSPSNPTGMSYNQSELRALANVLIKHPNVCILSDDIYEHIRWDDTPFTSIANVAPELMDRIITINGVSKAYAMTGWRIGYIACTNNSIVGAMKKIQSHATSGPCSISQEAAVAALATDIKDILPMRDAYKIRHDNVLSALNAIDGIECISTDGSFYLFPNCQELMRIKGLDSDIDLCNALIEEAHIAPVPGSAFGAPGFLRLSTATSDDRLKEAMERLQSWAKNECVTR